MKRSESADEAGREPLRKGQGGKRQGGKPRGRPKQAEEVRALARRHSASALAALIEVAMHGTSESARIAAANALLDRGWGKPRLALPDVDIPEHVQFIIGPPQSAPGMEEAAAAQVPEPEER